MGIIDEKMSIIRNCSSYTITLKWEYDFEVIVEGLSNFFFLDLVTLTGWVFFLKLPVNYEIIIQKY